MDEWFLERVEGRLCIDKGGVVPRHQIHDLFLAAEAACVAIERHFTSDSN